VTWTLVVTATVVLWLDGHGRLSDLWDLGGRIFFPLILLAVPGPLLVGMILRANIFSPPVVVWSTLILGLFLDFLLYWLVIRSIISIILLIRRSARGHSS
jgi:hypothetical protein